MHPFCTLSPFFSSGFSPPFPPSSLVSAVPGPVFLFQNTNRCNTVQYSSSQGRTRRWGRAKNCHLCTCSKRRSSNSSSSSLLNSPSPGSATSSCSCGSAASHRTGGPVGSGVALERRGRGGHWRFPQQLPQVRGLPCVHSLPCVLAQLRFGCSRYCCCPTSVSGGCRLKTPLPPTFTHRRAEGSEGGVAAFLARFLLPACQAPPVAPLATATAQDSWMARVAAAAAAVMAGAAPAAVS